jgi:heptaprenyl diphosphate synthase
VVGYTSFLFHFKLSRQKATAYFGVLLALALALSWLEQFLLPLLALPPGVKPGLSNIPVMLAAGWFGPGAGLLLAMGKAVFAGATRGLTAMLLSGAGGLPSALATGFLLRKPHKQLGNPGIGIVGAITHNAAQLGAAAVLMRTASVFYATPVLLLASVLSGVLTGSLLSVLRKRFYKL